MPTWREEIVKKKKTLSGALPIPVNSSLVAMGSVLCAKGEPSASAARFTVFYLHLSAGYFHFLGRIWARGEKVFMKQLS